MYSTRTRGLIAVLSASVALSVGGAAPAAGSAGPRFAAALSEQCEIIVDMKRFAQEQKRMLDQKIDIAMQERNLVHNALTDNQLEIIHKELDIARNDVEIIQIEAKQAGYLPASKPWQDLEAEKAEVVA